MKFCNKNKVLRIFDRLSNDRRKGVLAGCLFHVCFLGLYFFFYFHSTLINME